MSITTTIGVHENAFFMKEVDDGVKVQKRILERLEAASAILSARQREDVHNQDPANRIPLPGHKLDNPMDG